jgi:hypothetical protein
MLPDAAPADKPPRRWRKGRQAYRQAVDAQAGLLEVLELCRADAVATQDRELRAKLGVAMGAMARGWDLLEDRKRVLRGKPLPGHLRPDLAPKAKRVLPSFRSYDAIDVSPPTALPASEADGNNV